MALVILASAGPVGAQVKAPLGVHVFGGVVNTPKKFDVARESSFDAGVQLGVGFEINLYPNLSVRGDLSRVSNSGRDITGGIDESVKIRRTYYGVSADLRFPMSSGLTPYLTGGGGFVSLVREGETANSYAFDVTEFTALGGVGVTYTLHDSGFRVFLEATTWIYDRSASGETQLDAGVKAGVGYSISLGR